MGFSYIGIILLQNIYRESATSLPRSFWPLGFCFCSGRICFGNFSRWRHRCWCWWLCWRWCPSERGCSWTLILTSFSFFCLGLFPWHLRFTTRSRCRSGNCIIRSLSLLRAQGASRALGSIRWRRTGSFLAYLRWEDKETGRDPKEDQNIIEGSLEVKLPTIWTVEKQRWEESEEKRSEERRCRCAKR